MELWWAWLQWVCQTGRYMHGREVSGAAGPGRDYWVGCKEAKRKSQQRRIPFGHKDATEFLRAPVWSWLVATLPTWVSRSGDWYPSGTSFHQWSGPASLILNYFRLNYFCYINNMCYIQKKWKILIIEELENSGKQKGERYHPYPITQT